MKTLIELGQGVQLDIPRLLETRAGIAANSGAGKSWLLRLMAEQLALRVPTIILDREGEYATLREKIDMVLVGKGGEVDTAIATAAKLARKLAELRLSAVIDMYDLSKYDRPEFVKRFLESLLSLPRRMWGPMFVLIDEAQDFAPESGRDAVSTNAVVDLACQGRKRGIGCALATQRLSKLSKNAMSEANNLLIGRFAQDVDLRRASDLLGFPGKHEWATMRDGKPGEFFAVGPAFEHTGVKRFRCSAVTTTHARAGQRYTVEPPKPSKAILKVAPEFADLKRQVEEEQDELTRLRAENRVLRAKRPAAAAAPAVDTAHYVLQGREDVLRMIEPAVSAVNIAVADSKRTLDQALRELLIVSSRKAFFGKDAKPTSNGQSRPALHPMDAKQLDTIKASIRQTAGLPPPGSRRCPHCRDVFANPDEHEHSCRKRSTPARVHAGASDPAIGKGGVRRMMVALAQHPDGLDRRQLAILSHMAIDGGGFGNYLSTMRRSGWMEDRNGKMTITDDGIEALGSYEPLPTGAALVNYWLDWCGGGSSGKRRILQALIDAGPDGLDRESLAAAADMDPAGGGFGNYLSNLRGVQIIEGGKQIKAAPLFFES